MGKCPLNVVDEATFLIQTALAFGMFSLFVTDHYPERTPFVLKPNMFCFSSIADLCFKAQSGLNLPYPIKHVGEGLL